MKTGFSSWASRRHCTEPVPTEEDLREELQRKSQLIQWLETKLALERAKDPWRTAGDVAIDPGVVEQLERDNAARRAEADSWRRQVDWLIEENRRLHRELMAETAKRGRP